RTPMNAIIGMTEIAQKNVGDSERVAECLRKVSLSSKHLLGLINDVLDMSKIESGKMTLNIVPMSLRNAMDDI
ncbi:MAG: sensor histidine kinase, partial [Lachnospiraceae bacterium]|nr:sensor histidine kinase [Lachnospiraceae bacterium]